MATIPSAPPPRLDAWILLATLYAAGPRGASLSDIIAAADAIEHAIPTYEEVHGAMARLQAAGVVLCRGRAYRVARRVAVAFLQQRAGRRRVQTDLDWLHRWMARHVAYAGRPRPVGSAVSREVFERAVAAYYAAHAGSPPVPDAGGAPQT